MSDHGFTKPLNNMQGFIQHLRANGFSLGHGDTKQAVIILKRTTGNLLQDKDRLRSLLVSNREQWKNFDSLFEAFWFSKGKVSNNHQPAAKTSKRSSKLPKAWAEHLSDHSNDDNNNRLPQTETDKYDNTDQDVENKNATGRLIATDKTSQMKTDFRQFIDKDEIAEAEKLAYKLAQAIRYKLSRRQQLNKRGKWVNLRRTIRANMRYGGDLIDLKTRHIPERPVRIVLFLDVSGSMQHYSRFFLQFVKGLVCQWLQSDAFLFHTKLIRITDTVRDNNTSRSMTKLSLMAEGFGGGTKLGECLKIFNTYYAKKTLTSKTAVIILSDGYEVGTPQDLTIELQRLKKRANKLIWLNPLLGWENYAPVTSAMQAALPYIDHFAAANTLETLAAIEPELARL